MSRELTERLRTVCIGTEAFKLCKEAADRIAALELALAQRDRQINELKELLCEAGQHIEYDPGGELSARIDAARATSSAPETSRPSS